MKYAILVISLVVMAYLIIDFNGRTAELNYLSAERDQVEARLTARLGTKAALETQIAYATSKAAVEEYGYQNHMARPGDVVVVPIQPPSVAPTPTPRPQPVTSEMSNLERWVMLIFGAPTPAP